MGAPTFGQLCDRIGILEERNRRLHARLRWLYIAVGRGDFVEHLDRDEPESRGKDSVLPHRNQRDATCPCGKIFVSQSRRAQGW